MSVYRTKSGSWRIQFFINGRNYIKSSKTKNKKAAELMEAKWRTEIHARRYLGDRKEIRVQELLDNYLKLPLANTTLKNARAFFKRFTADVDCNINASEFNQNEILVFVQKRLAQGIKQSTLRTSFLYFSGAWHDGNKEAYNIPDLKLPTLKKSTPKIEYLSAEEEQKLFSYLDSRKDRGSGAGEFKGEVRDIFKLLLDTGLRHNELCRLEWNKVDLNRRTINAFRKKTQTWSLVEMTNRVHQVLLRRSETKKHEKWVFTDQEMTGHRRDSTTHLNGVLVKAGLPYTTHQLRHTYASNLLQSGMSLVEVKDNLGHGSINSTMIYAHLQKGQASKKAAEVLNEKNAEANRKLIKAV
jgi:integrase